MHRSDAANPPPVTVAHLNAPEELRASKRHAHGHSPLRVVLIGLAVLGLLMILLMFGYNAAHGERVYKGVSVLGTELSGMTRSEGEAALAKASEGYPAAGVTLKSADREWSFSPAELGAGVDIDSTLDAAMSVGRTGSLLDDLGSQLRALFGGVQITPILKHDAALVDKSIEKVAAALDRPAIDSKLEQDEEGRVRLTPSSKGSLVDRDAVRAAMTQSLAAVPFAPVEIAMHEVAPKVTEEMLRASEAQALLITEQPIELQAGRQSWTVEPADLRKMLALTPAEADTWAASLNGEVLTAYLQPIAEELWVEPVNADVLVGRSTVTLREDESGAELDVPTAVAAIQEASLQEDAAARVVELPVREVLAEVQTEQVQAVYYKASSLVTEGIRLRFGEDGYILRNNSVTGFINVERAQGGPGAWKIVVDEDVLASRISGVASTYINRPAADAQFRMVGGKPTRTSSGRDGYKVDVAASMQNVLRGIETYAGGERLQVNLVVNVTPPTIKDADIASIHTPDLLGTGQTSYATSSAERAHNVELGTRKIDGSLIPPGGVFSTVDTIGPLTLDAGFKMGYMIINQGGNVTTVPAEAGGICQVATTLFHSVFWAGLPMVERNWHSYWIASYGVQPSGLQGLDATIAPPEKDFRFKNTTGNWLLIRATADSKNVTFKLYGVDPGWKVSVGKPVITNVVKTDPTPIYEKSSHLPEGKEVKVENAQDGFSASITRTVTDANGNVIETWVAKSRYVPARNRYMVGTGE